MPLDLDKVVPQVGGMVSRLKTETRERAERLEAALDTLEKQSGRLAELSQKISAARTTWLVAGLTEATDRRYPPSSTPIDFTVLATDGSHMAVDRHRAARCYLINIGAVTLRYGAGAGATLESFPRLYSGEEEMVIAPTGTQSREQPIEANLLGIKRGVDEVHRLAELAAGLDTDRPALALVDGTLVLWGLEPYPEFVTEALLHKGLLSALSQIEKLNTPARKTALASYISFTGATEVVNALRVALCPHNPPDCDRYCPVREPKPCDTIAGTGDRALFGNILAPGERSALFTSGSPIVKKHYGNQQVHFYYLRLEDEIARVEIPRWVALDESLLNLTHSLILDQCRRGQGYPVALAEAHEQAVVTNADKESFWQLVESSMVDEKLPSLHSAKSFSKRTRWV